MWWAIGFAAWSVAMLVAVALCRAAAGGDRANERSCIEHDAH